MRIHQNILTTRFGEVYDRYLFLQIRISIEKRCRIKSYFLADENGYPSMDYDMLTAQMRDGTKYAQYIDIFGDLELSDYYRTDALVEGTDWTDVARHCWGNGATNDE